MNEPGMSLTIIGVIATLVSILFASAAFYISRKRRLYGSSGTYRVPGTAAPPQKSHPAGAPPTGSITADAGPQTAEKPVFQKLSPRGLVDPFTNDAQQPHQYLWE